MYVKISHDVSDFEKLTNIQKFTVIKGISS